MTEKIREQIMAIRDSGVTNMLNATQVQFEANAREFYELVIFIDENQSEYARFILFGDAGAE